MRHRAEDTKKFIAATKHANCMVNPARQQFMQAVDKQRVHADYHQREHRLADAGIFRQQDENEQAEDDPTGAVECVGGRPEPFVDRDQWG